VGSSTVLTHSTNSGASTLSDQHITPALRDHTIHIGKLRAEDIESHHFMDKFPINSDGWMYGENEELVLWIPPIHRPYIHRSNTIWVTGKDRTEVDFSKFVHGLNWATVYVHCSSN
jgi:hypothetical protein